MADARCTDTMRGGHLGVSELPGACDTGIAVHEWDFMLLVTAILSLECWQAARCKSDIHLEDAPFFIITCKNLMTTLLEGRMRT